MSVKTKQPDHRPSGPSAAFWTAILLLQHALKDDTATISEIARRFVTALDLMECVPVEQPVYAAAKAALMSNFRTVIGRDSVAGRESMGLRRGAAKDADLHGKKVLLYAWVN